MPWIRLSDNYIDNEKFQALSDRAFRLWHEAMAYCRRHQTDGLIPFPIMRNFPSFTRGCEKQLSSPARAGISPLWELIPGTGYKVHNYLHWNLSKEEEGNERAGAAARMRKFRSKDECYAVTNGATSPVTNALVPDWIGEDLSLSTLEEKSALAKPDIADWFAQFWAAYPRKVGKDAAWKAWQKRKPTEDTARTVMAALAWQVTQDNWLREGGRYVPNPATWINQGRWDDEPMDTPRINDRTLNAARAVEEFLRS